MIARLLRAVASLRLTTLGLAWLALLVFWGTLYQARVGLPEANARFFGAWIFYAGGLLPLPALRGTLLLLGMNLFLALAFRMPRRWSLLGLWLAHGGLLLLLFGGAWSAWQRSEGHLYIGRGESVSEAWTSDGTPWALPFTLRLDSARVLYYAGTSEPRSYTAFVTWNTGGESRSARLGLDSPLRSDGYSVYLSSFGPGSSSGERLVLLVTHDEARWLPYVSSLCISLGLLLHVLTGWRRWWRRLEPNHA